MKKTDKIGTVASLLSRALTLSSGINGHQMEQARTHIRGAIDQIDKYRKGENKRSQQSLKMHEEWWGNVVSGAVRSSLANTARIAEGENSQEATMKRMLQGIDNMLKQEQDKLSELEKIAQEPDVDDVEMPSLSQFRPPQIFED